MVKLVEHNLLPSKGCLQTFWTLLQFDAFPVGCFVKAILAEAPSAALSWTLRVGVAAGLLAVLTGLKDLVRPTGQFVGDRWRL